MTMRCYVWIAGVETASMRAVVAAAICVLMVGQPLLGAGFAKKKTVSTQEIEGEQRVLHALNRLTFGPGPGDIQAVQAMGLQRWFEQQLNPVSSDAGLEERLAMFPAMKMSQAELMTRYPSPQVLRQMIEKNEPLPSDPVLHAIYADQIAFYKMAKEKREVAAPTIGNTEDDAGRAMEAKGGWGVDLPGKLGDEAIGGRKGCTSAKAIKRSAGFS